MLYRSRVAFLMLWRCLPQSDAFVQRCSDLLDVCTAQLQFNPTAQLKRGEINTTSNEAEKTKSAFEENPVVHNQLPFFGAFQTEAIRHSIGELQEAFGKALSRLKTLGRNVLQVKATNWHTEYAFFKEQVLAHNTPKSKTTISYLCLETILSQ